MGIEKLIQDVKSRTSVLKHAVSEIHQDIKKAGWMISAATAVALTGLGGCHALVDTNGEPTTAVMSAPCPTGYTTQENVPIRFIPYGASELYCDVSLEGPGKQFNDSVTLNQGESYEENLGSLEVGDYHLFLEVRNFSSSSTNSGVGPAAPPPIATADYIVPVRETQGELPSSDEVDPYLNGITIECGGYVWE